MALFAPFVQTESTGYRRCAFAIMSAVFGRYRLDAK